MDNLQLPLQPIKVKRICVRLLAKGKVCARKRQFVLAPYEIVCCSLLRSVMALWCPLVPVSDTELCVQSIIPSRLQYKKKLNTSAGLTLIAWWTVLKVEKLASPSHPVSKWKWNHKNAKFINLLPRTLNHTEVFKQLFHSWIPCANDPAQTLIPLANQIPATNSQSSFSSNQPVSSTGSSRLHSASHWRASSEISLSLLSAPGTKTHHWTSPSAPPPAPHPLAAASSPAAAKWSIVRWQSRSGPGRSSNTRVRAWGYVWYPSRTRSRSRILRASRSW